MNCPAFLRKRARSCIMGYPFKEASYALLLQTMGGSEGKMPPERRRYCHRQTAQPDPRSLIKNIPSKNELWKAPVKDWLQELDEKATEKAEKKRKRKENAQQ